MTLWDIKHQFFDLLRIVGLRDRLRCPTCRAVGTWKPHGGWLDKGDTAGRRRWLCKFCGIYRQEDRLEYCYPSPSKGSWQRRSAARSNRDNTQECPTPHEILSNPFIGKPDKYTVNPWAG